jgi:hypothetical protein
MSISCGAVPELEEVRFEKSSHRAKRATAFVNFGGWLVVKTGPKSVYVYEYPGKRYTLVNSCLSLTRSDYSSAKRYESLVECLYRLRVISEQSRDAYKNWVYGVMREHHRQSKLHRLMENAEELGYKVVKDG